MEGDEELLARARARLGTTLRGKYTLESVLGVGGMAVVYGATHRNGRPVAIKMLHPELSLRADIRARFLREGHAANAVKHEGAVAVLDDDTAEDGSAFIVMERLDGASLDALWEENGGRLPLRVVAAVGIQLLDVLAAAHAKGVIHRDLKPANVFLTRKGEVRVLDFGIARVKDAVSSHATQTGMMMGTPAFMAPEQARGRTSEIGAETDLWAVGATLFTLASGERVHEAENAQELLVVAATTPARSLRSVLKEAPEPLVEVIDRALAFDKGKRWPSAGAMRDALRLAADAAFGKTDGTPSLASVVAAQEKTEVKRPPALAELDAPQPSGPAGTLPLPPPFAPARSKDAEAVGAWPLSPLVGTTTARPVSTSPPTLRRRLAAATGTRPEILIPLIALGGLLTVGGIVTALVLGLRRTPASAASAHASESGAPINLLMPTTPTAWNTPSATPGAAPTESTLTFEALPKPSATPPGKAALETARPSNAAAPPPQPSFARPPPPAKKNCDPPFTIDPASGKKIFRAECL